MKSYPDFENLAHATQSDPQRFIVKNIAGKSMEANDRSHILFANIFATFDPSRVV